MEYAKQKVDPLIAEGIKDLPIPSDVACRIRILDSINKVKFLSFFDEYKVQKVGNWSVVPSPWEMTSQVSRINAYHASCNVRRAGTHCPSCRSLDLFKATEQRGRCFARELKALSALQTCRLNSSPELHHSLRD